jgi:hypothetical protein
VLAQVVQGVTAQRLVLMQLSAWRLAHATLQYRQTVPDTAAEHCLWSQRTGGTPLHPAPAALLLLSAHKQLWLVVSFTSHADICSASSNHDDCAGYTPGIHTDLYPV